VFVGVRCDGAILAERGARARRDAKRRARIPDAPLAAPHRAIGLGRYLPLRIFRLLPVAEAKTPSRGRFDTMP